MFKNVAAKFIVFAFDSTTNLPKTGDAANITAYVAKDYGTVTVLADTSATEMDSTNAKGYYLFDAAQGETNGDCLMVSAKSATGNIVVVGAPAVIYTRPTTGWLAPTVAARTLDVTATGGAGIDWSNVEAPTTALALTGTTIAVTQKVDVDTIKTNPVVNGGTITFPTTATLASTTNITAGVVTTATNVTTVNGLAANVITAAATAADFGAEVAAAVWGDTVAGDFTVAASVGKSVMNGVALGTGLTVAAVSGAVGSVTGAVASVTGNVGGNVTGTVGSVVGAVGSVTGAVGSVTGNVGGNVVGTVASVVGAVGSVTGNVGGNITGTIGGLTIAAIKDFFDTDSGTNYAGAIAGSVVKEIADNAGGSSLTENGIADALLDRADAIETGITPRGALRIATAANAGKLSGAATTSIAIRNVADSKNVVTATVDANGNRTATAVDTA